MDIEQLRREIPTRLRAALGESFHAAILYGSRARGDNRDDSDVDILVIVDDDEDLGSVIDRSVDALYRFQLEHDLVIHPMPARRSTWENGTYAIVRHARAEGIRL